jgi:hypothetical protein
MRGVVVKQQGCAVSLVQDAGDEATNAQFAKAMALTGAEFLDCVDYITHVSGTSSAGPAVASNASGLRSVQQPLCRLPELHQLNIDSL